MNLRPLSLAALMMLVVACEPTPHPDYAIWVTPTATGGIATPPACAPWSGPEASPLDNQPIPQFGCATTRDLAMQVERPNDLVHARQMGDMRGVTAVGAVRRYDNNQPRGLMMPGDEVSHPAASTAPSVASPLTGDVTGSIPSSGASSSAAGP